MTKITSRKRNDAIPVIFILLGHQLLHPPNILDLHLLQVEEAVEAAEEFIEKTINSFRVSYIIAERGPKSRNSYSKIKPAGVTKLLKKGIT